MRGAWRAAMREFARRPQTYLQFSGLPFLFQERWREDDARSVLDDALRSSAPGGLMFASDYPMLLRFATYREWVAAVERYPRRATPVRRPGGGNLGWQRIARQPAAARARRESRCPPAMTIRSTKPETP